MNYYFKLRDIRCKITHSIKNMELAEDLQRKINIFMEENSTIHIGKRSFNYKPLFYKTSYFKSVKEIKNFYNKNKEDLKIINEYNEEMTFKQLEKELIDWNKNNILAKIYNCDENYYKDKEGYWFAENEFC